MKKLGFTTLVILFPILTVSGCSIAPHNAYEQKKKPEHRQYYRGVNGFKQFIKDESYLANKEQSELCQRYLLSYFENERSGLKSACKDHQLEMIEQLQKAHQNSPSLYPSTSESQS